MSRLAQWTQREFTESGRALLGELWDSGQEEYETYWLGANSPQLSTGEFFLLGWMDAKPLARLALWKPHSGDALFFLYARSLSADPAAVRDFLEAVKSFCRGRGVGDLTGPLQFSTWHPYRFIREKGTAAFFPGEQKLPAEYHADFLAAGFADIAEYQSTMVEDLAKSIEVGLAMGVDRGLAGMEIQTFGAGELPKLLPELYRISCEIFRDNFAYAPLAFADFLKLSEGGKGADTALILALAGGKSAGFTYSYGIGAYDAGDGKPEATAVLKTLGVTPELRSRGLGYAASYLTHKHWLEKGYRRIIHAYMKSDNHSRSMSSHFGQSLRTYALMKGMM